MNIKELYQEIILEHGKNPRNLRKTDNFNKDAKGYNPLCGDSVHVYLKLDEKKKQKMHLLKEADAQYQWHQLL